LWTRFEQAFAGTFRREAVGLAHECEFRHGRRAIVALPLAAGSLE
jgi:hypothetical protein